MKLNHLINIAIMKFLQDVCHVCHICHACCCKGELKQTNNCSKVQFFRHSSCQFSPVLFILAVDAKEGHPGHPKILHLDGNDDRYTTIAAVGGDFDDDGGGVHTVQIFSKLTYCTTGPI